MLKRSLKEEAKAVDIYIFDENEKLTQDRDLARYTADAM